VVIEKSLGVGTSDMPLRDESWWRRFKDAPQELRRVMNDTVTAREAVECMERKGATTEQLAPFGAGSWD
jgi:hypothetical protein